MYYQHFIYKEIVYQRDSLAQDFSADTRSRIKSSTGKLLPHGFPITANSVLLDEIIHFGLEWTYTNVFAVKILFSENTICLSWQINYCKKYFSHNLSAQRWAGHPARKRYFIAAEKRLKSGRQRRRKNICNIFSVLN